VIERIGNYRITEEIGSGGTAVVYKGVQESLGRTVAIKALKTAVMGDENVVARFEREATSLASFQHENINTIYDFFRMRGALFIIMEYVEGIDLYDLLERSGSLPGDVCAIVSLQVARALDYAHFRGVIHRDVKPANIIISKSGSVKLTDFGIARVESSDLTEVGIGLGTPAYMSPEQILGERLDHRADIFSLGIVMYQMVTGRKPFVEDDQHTAMEKIRLHQPETPRASNPACPAGLEQIILRCMQKAQKDRYDSTQDLVIALEQFLAQNVSQNYRARLVLFLREHTVVSDNEATETLHPAMIGEYIGKGPMARIRRRLPASGLALPIAIVALLLGGLVGATVFSSRTSGPTAGTTAKGGAAGTTPARCPATGAAASSSPAVGYLRVLAHPWARVEVDDKAAATTPFDRPLPLPPGKHSVRLLNPYFETTVHGVVIESDKVFTLTVPLKRVAAGWGEKKASPGETSP
jgi:eukaryotic-like serine/threonine-protein kinase